MAKISTGYTFGLTKTQFLACEMIFSGKSAREVARLLFPCTKKDTLEEDPSKVEYYARTVRKWMKDEKFKDCYKALLKELASLGAQRMLVNASTVKLPVTSKIERGSVIGDSVF